MSLKNPNDTVGNRTRALPVCSVVPLLQCNSNNYYMFWVCVYRLRYPACNARAPYYHAWSVRIYKIFPHYLINSMIFGKKLPNTKYVLIFSTVLSETSLILRSTEGDIVITCTDLQVKYPLFLSGFNETWILSTEFWKVLKCQILWKSFLCWRTGTEG